MGAGWTGKRVTVMGLGGFGGGVGVTRWLARHGARVTVTDQAGPEKLAGSLAEIAGLDIKLHLGGHDERDFRDTDLVVVNPAVPESSPFLHVARDAGVPLTTEINLFVERCPARTVGVTGSVGKSTVTAMIGQVLEEGTKGPMDVGIVGSGGQRPKGAGGRVWVGGNIGRSLLDGLGQITADDIVVLELSSFQLERTPLVRWSPHVAVVTNVTPNHLDWHGSFAAYLAAKLNIVRFQQPGRDVIVIQDTSDLRRSFDELFGDLAGIWRYGLDGDTPVAVMQSAAAVDCDDCRLRWPDLRLEVPGRHNRENAAAALTVAHAIGMSAEVTLAALAQFAALPHRLQKVAEAAGVSWYDDSKSTTPEAALTAMRALAPGARGDGPRKLLVILGGYDKGSDLRPVAEEAARRAKFAACIGRTGAGLAEATKTAGGAAGFCGNLTAAVAECRRRAAPGDVILLSPACASWDQFVDYRQRGQRFAELARGGS
ncbi:MAG: UDP-N-acetylmuramoyl-L-alanine--D-glutamate ligase [Planctomycetota bacterium]